MQGAAPQWSKVLHICAQPACMAVAAETVFVFSTRLNSCSAGRETRHWNLHGRTAGVVAAMDALATMPAAQVT